MTAHIWEEANGQWRRFPHKFAPKQVSTALARLQLYIDQT